MKVTWNPLAAVIVGMGAVGTLALWLVIPNSATAHCDTMDGPVVKAARIALTRGEVTPSLKWVMPADEPELRQSFTKALAARQSSSARGLADLYFMETLVRLHRMGEGAPYTGLKPAGSNVDPAIKAADIALARGSASSLLDALHREIDHGVRTRFARVQETTKQSEKSVSAGREYVAAYVDFVHYVERVHTALVSKPGEHGSEGHGAEGHSTEDHGTAGKDAEPPQRGR